MSVYDFSRLNYEPPKPMIFVIFVKLDSCLLTVRSLNKICPVVNFESKAKYSETSLQRTPSGPRKGARYKEVSVI